MLTHIVFYFSTLFLGLQAHALDAPKDPFHPGSKTYSFTPNEKTFTCSGRAVTVVSPANRNTLAPVVVFGHGQALSLNHYRKTFEHLAGKGVAVIFPAYDKGFFDQDWQRMGRDFIQLTDCVLKQSPQLDASRIIYGGHSKGAYVASIAAGLAPSINPNAAPKSVVIFAPAGADSSSLSKIENSVVLTVVFSEADTIVSREFSETIYSRASSDYRQFILLKNYAGQKADHMWPLTESSMFGGGPEGPFHYYGSWKWLVAAAEDLDAGGDRKNSFLYGDAAIDKGDRTKDELKRSW